MLRVNFAAIKNFSFHIHVFVFKFVLKIISSLSPFLLFLMTEAPILTLITVFLSILRWIIFSIVSMIILNHIFFYLNFVFKIIIPFKLFLFFLFSGLVIWQIWIANNCFFIESIRVWIDRLHLFERRNFRLNIHIFFIIFFFRFYKFEFHVIILIIHLFLFIIYIE